MNDDIREYIENLGAFIRINEACNNEYTSIKVSDLRQLVITVQSNMADMADAIEELKEKQKYILQLERELVASKAETKAIKRTNWKEDVLAKVDWNK